MSDARTQQVHDALAWVELATEALHSAKTSIGEPFRGEYVSAASRRLLRAISILTEVPHVATPAIRDPDSGRPSLVEPAALSDLNHNYGG